MDGACILAHVWWFDATPGVGSMSFGFAGIISTGSSMAFASAASRSRDRELREESEKIARYTGNAEGLSINKRLRWQYRLYRHGGYVPLLVMSVQCAQERAECISIWFDRHLSGTSSLKPSIAFKRQISRPFG